MVIRLGTRTLISHLPCGGDAPVDAEPVAKASLPERFNSIFAEAGPSIDEIDVILQNAEGAWTFGFLDGSAMLVECRAEGDSGSLVFSAPIGQPRVGSEIEVLDALMRLNGAWRDSGGVRAARNAASDDLVLVYEWTSTHFESKDVASVINHLSALQVQWTDWMQHAIEETSPLGHPLA